MTETTYEYLPMPWARARRLESDWREYRERRRRHLEAHPDYDRGWHRPTEDTARRIWKLVADPMDLKIGDLLPRNKKLVPDEGEDLGLRVMQALVVALDAAVAAGERGGLKSDDDDELKSRGMLTFNGVAESLAQRWSDNYRVALETTPSLRNMPRQTVEVIRRDLKLNGLDCSAIWNAVRNGVPGIYETRRIPERGYVVTVEWGSQMLAKFDLIVNADANYRRYDRPNRILLASAPEPRLRVAKKVAGGRAYQIAEPGPRAREVIQWLQSTTLWLDTAAVKDDVAKLESSLDGDKKSRSHVNSGQALRSQIARIEGAGGVDADGFIEIRSGFHLTTNRRYEADHLWPGRVTDKDRRPTEVAPIPSAPLTMTLEASRRDRWFLVRPAADPDTKGQLVGFDVSASQFQIQAMLIGDHELEARLAKQSLKKIGVDLAWARHEDGRHRLSDPERLKAKPELLENSVKQAALRRGYGSPPLWIVKEFRDDPDQYADLGDGKAIDGLLREMGLGKIIDSYLPACGSAARAAYRRDKYAGFVLADPFEDNFTFRWNPIRRTSDEIRRVEDKIARLLAKPNREGDRSALDDARRELEALQRSSIVRSSGTKIYIDPPVGQPNEAGDYPVDQKTLATSVAPCLIHVLDAMFLGLVVEGLKKRGVHPVVIHDAFLVPTDGRAELQEAIDEAGEPWLRRLGPIYDALVDYLKDDGKFGPWANAIREQWRCRVAAGNWPRFRMGDTGSKRGRSFQITRYFEPGEPIEGFWADVQRGNAKRVEAETVPGAGRS